MSPYAVEREIEDIAALLDLLPQAQELRPRTSQRDQEAGVDDSRSTTERYWARIAEVVAANRRSEAVKLFLKLVGVPSFLIAVMPLMPMWSKLKAIAHTLPYDDAIVGDNQRGKPLPTGRWASVTVPALVMDGGKSPAWMGHGNRSLASILPNARYQTLEGQTHMLKPKAHEPILVEFFNY
jgi:pimeloyl-ACP methyl ester carboxylesterase